MSVSLKNNLFFKMKRGLISTPPSDMLPTTEGGKSNAWLRQKNAVNYFIMNYKHKDIYCSII